MLCFSDTLKLGSSVPWPDAMEKLTGQRNVDIGPLLEYFEPLSKWLENEVEDEDKTWDDNCPQFPDPTPGPGVSPHGGANGGWSLYTSSVFMKSGIVVSFIISLICQL